jgi:hypothetical protein
MATGQTERRMRLSMTDVEVCFNRAMGLVYGRLDLLLGESSLPSELRTVAASGVAILGDRVYLREHWALRATTAEQMDRWTAERWVNDTHLRIPPASSSTSGRAQLLGWGVVVSLSLLNDAGQRHCPFDLQAIVSLQPASGESDPENPFELGAMNLYTVQAAGDDLSTDIETFQEPVVTLTVRSQKESLV